MTKKESLSDLNTPIAKMLKKAKEEKKAAIRTKKIAKLTLPKNHIVWLLS